MPNTIIKGKIQNHHRSEKYNDDGIKYIHYFITIEGKKYTVNLPGSTDIYFEEQLDTVLEVDENNIAIAGLCSKKGYAWGKTKSLKNEVKETDRFELAKGIVQEKRKETFNQSRGTTGTDSYTSNSKTIVTYTIVLPEKTFRVVDVIGKHIKPNTEIVALLEQNVAYIIKDKTNNKVYGKPRKDFIIALFLWLAFNAAMIYALLNGKKAIFTSYNMVLVMGNLVFGIASLISVSSFISSTKTLKLFNQMVDEDK